MGWSVGVDGLDDLFVIRNSVFVLSCVVFSLWSCAPFISVIGGVYVRPRCVFVSSTCFVLAPCWPPFLSSVAFMFVIGGVYVCHKWRLFVSSAAFVFVIGKCCFCPRVLSCVSLIFVAGADLSGCLFCLHAKESLGTQLPNKPQAPPHAAPESA